MPAYAQPPANPAPNARRRQRRQLIVVCLLLLLAAVLLVALPVHLPWPARLGLAFLDLAAACALWLFSRQQLSGK